MTQEERTKLLAACAHAKMFLEAADLELGDGVSRAWRDQATESLKNALTELTYEPPF